MKNYFLFLALLTASFLEAQENPRPWLPKNDLSKIEVKVMTQVWATWTHGLETFANGQYEPVEDRPNLYLRRTRIGFAGEPYRRLFYSVTLLWDQVGRDNLSGTTGSPSQNVGVLDAYLQWKIGKSELLCLTGGWLRPQVQRESITSGFATNSLEKSPSQVYFRNHLTGFGLGRAAGLNLGGWKAKGLWSVDYNVGVFHPLAFSNAGNTSGEHYSPLLAGRLSVGIGDPEAKRYSISRDINFFGKRKGISLDGNASRQGRTDLFGSNTTFGPGFLFNWGNLNFDGEWIWMKRKTFEDPSGNDQRLNTATGHLRLGVNLPTGRFLLEPVAMIAHFKGPLSKNGQELAATLEEPAGHETTYDLGLNWYLDGKNLKLALHYTWRKGDAGEAGDGAEVNPYFFQNGVGAMHRGDYLGVMVNAIF